MLGLPSTTAVGRAIPKKIFYRNLKLTGAQKDSFVAQVGQIRIEHSLKESLMGVPAGERVAEVVVLRLDVRERVVPREVLAAIMRGMPNKVLAVCRHEGECAFAVMRGKLYAGEWVPEDVARVELRGSTLDDLWDGICEQVIFADRASEEAPSTAVSLAVDERIERERAREGLRKQVTALERKHAREKQPAKRNDLFKQLQEARRQLAELTD